MSKRLTRLARLATREDVLAVCGSWSLPHVHKTLALLVVYHTLHRLVLGMDGAATLPLVAALAVHLLLSLSAVVFTVPVHTKMPHVLDGLYRAQVAASTAAPLHHCATAPMHRHANAPALPRAGARVHRTLRGCHAARVARAAARASVPPAYVLAAGPSRRRRGVAPRVGRGAASYCASTQ